MVKLEDIPVDASVTWTEEVLLNDADVAKLATVDNILAVQHDHTASDITDFDTEVSNNTTVTTLVSDLNTAEADIATNTSDISTLDSSKLWKSELRTGLSNRKMYHTNWSWAETEVTLWSSWTVLTSNGASSAPTFQSLPTTRTKVVKSSNETRTSTSTLANDTDLLFAMSANTNYHVRGKVFFWSNSTPDFKFSFTWPTSPTLLAIRRKVMQQTVTAYEAQLIDVVYWTSVSVLTTTGQINIVEFDAIIHNGANAGNFAFQWAQNTSNADSTLVYAGSYLEYITT